MTDQTMSIREMCDNFGVTPRTLRFYEAKELIRPIREGQKRLFTRRCRARLTLILRGKRFGFSLEDIRQLLDMYDMDEHGAAQLDRTLDLARLRLAAMESQRAEIDQTITELRHEILRGEAQRDGRRQTQKQKPAA